MAHVWFTLQQVSAMGEQQVGKVSRQQTLPQHETSPGSPQHPYSPGQHSTRVVVFPQQYAGNPPSASQQKKGPQFNELHVCPATRAQARAKQRVATNVLIRMMWVVFLLLVDDSLSDSYISPAGSDISNCTLVAPCETVGRAMQETSEYGTVWLLPGVYIDPTLAPGVIVNKNLAFSAIGPVTYSVIALVTRAALVLQFHNITFNNTQFTLMNAIVSWHYCIFFLRAKLLS
eukprot:TRINITY_DN30463_c0_g1_i1.p1 TRINITY_DN30463_c0_g1~~TRINITY_DN30463_c0_g1_i1.p1  ORF type:complete len:231 (-),score=21.00 TRINITY_DN30463_c0_g1_i1:74-766(-)